MWQETILCILFRLVLFFLSIYYQTELNVCWSTRAHAPFQMKMHKKRSGFHTLQSNCDMWRVTTDRSTTWVLFYTSVHVLPIGTDRGIVYWKTTSGRKRFTCSLSVLRCSGPLTLTLCLVFENILSFLMHLRCAAVLKHTLGSHVSLSFHTRLRWRAWLFTQKRGVRECFTIIGWGRNHNTICVLILLISFFFFFFWPKCYGNFEGK